MIWKKRMKRLITGLLTVMMLVTMIPADMVKAAEECSHIRTEIVNAKPTTCTEDGYTGDEICSTCKVILNKGMVLKSSGHISYIDDEVAPTCSTTGLTRGFHCVVCNEVLTAQKTIPATGKHTYKDVKVDTRATTKGWKDTTAMYSV